MGKLSGKTVAILATHGFEQSELETPLEVLKREGAKVDVISPRAGKITGWSKRDWGGSVKVDKALADANADDYDAIVLPGGVMNPDTLRADPEAVAFVREVFASGKPTCAICHGPWTLVETGLLEGRTVTSYKTLKTDLRNAGAYWVDREVVIDHGLVTSRSPEDLPAFTRAMVEEIAGGTHLLRDAHGAFDAPSPTSTSRR